MTGLLSSLKGLASAGRTRPEHSPSGADTPAAGDFSALLSVALNPNATPAVAEAPTPPEGTEVEVGAEPGTAEAELGAGSGTAALPPEATAVATVDPNHIERSLDRLNPEFRARLERVVSRMQEEFGHQVRINETVRDQARQNHLYEQGRTRPGSVVTWTRSSNHTRGRAADLVIDGSYDNPAGYARLAQVAREEGLRTLGPRDPGHVELPRGIGGGFAPPRFAGVETAPKPEPPVPSAPAAGASQLAQVARVAEVARVATVARVAEVARVATVARVAEVARVARVATHPASAPTETLRAVAAEEEARRVRQSFDPEDSEEGMRGAADPAGRAPTERFELHAGLGTREASTGPRAERIAGLSGPEVAARLARILEVQDGAGARPLSSILLRLDNPAGGEDRIRVDLRGNSVGAAIDLSDPAAAERMNARVGELHRALEQKGLEAESLRIRSIPPPPTEAVDAARLAAAVLETESPRTPSGPRAGSDGGSQRERGGSPTHDEPRRGSDPHRQKPRKDQPGDRLT